MYVLMLFFKVVLEGRKVFYFGGRVRGEKGGGNSGFMFSFKSEEEIVCSYFR